MIRLSRSIKRRMLWILLTTFAVVWMAVAMLTVTNMLREVKDMFDAQLAHVARVLLNLTQSDIAAAQSADMTSPDDVTVHSLEPEFMFQILLDGRVVLRSPNAPAGIIADSGGYRTLAVGEDRWRVLRYREAGSPATVIVAGRRDVRSELLTNVAVEALWPLLLAIPLLALAILLGTNKALRPLGQVRHEIMTRNPGQLEPLDTAPVPREIRPVILAMNALFERLAATLEREKRFTSYAAHELRTPLAALKTQAHVALSAKDEARRQKAVQQIVVGVDRAAKLVEQLLTLARLDPPHSELRLERIDLVQSTQGVIEALTADAEAKRIRVSLQAPPELILKGDAAAITMLIRNLVDNAIRYTPDGGAVRVTWTVTPAVVTLSVADSGPGIPEEKQKSVFERFYRLDGTKAEGSGLGLSIARRAAELHQARIQLRNRVEGGLLVTVTFPAVG